MSLDNDDSLQFVPMEEWDSLERAFLADWPRGIPGYSALVTQRKLVELGLDYGFKVYRPRGDISNGMVALNKKGALNEIIIHYPNSDTSLLEDSLTNTKLIDWKRRIMVPYMPAHIQICVLKVARNLGLSIKVRDTEPSEMFIMMNKHDLFDVTNMPEGITFKPILDPNITSLIDTTWRNRYDGSKWFYNMLVRAKRGYGLYEREELVSWVFINDVGALTHVYTIENHRKKGYGEILLKHVCNVCVKDKLHVFGYCLKSNTAASRLYEKLGLKRCHEVQWYFISPKKMANL